MSTDFTGWVDSLFPVVGPDVPDQRVSPCRTAAFLEGKRQTILQVGKIRPLIRLADSNIDVMTELEGELSVSVEELMNDTGVAKVVIPFDNWLMDYITNQTMPVQDLHLLIDMVPTNPNWRTRWGGKVTEIHIKSDERGTHSIEITALHHREHAKRILIAANPIFPPEVQLPRMWVLPGPVRTICAATLAINLGRLFMPGWSTITNIFNPAAWINPLGPDAFLNMNPLAWPIQVAFVNPFLDQSRWSCIGAQWSDAHAAFKDVLTDAGVMMRAYTYLTTDADSPNTELEDLLSSGEDLWNGLTQQATSVHDLKKLAAPLRNCVVFSFEDKSGHTGPTGTVFDGLLNTVAVTLDQLITPITVDLRTGETYDAGQILNGQTVQDAAGVDHTYLLERLLLSAPDPPMVIWRQGEYNGMLTNDLTWRKGSTKTVMSGSKSPTLVNAAQTFAIKYGLAKLSDSLNAYAATLGTGGEIQAPGTNGLDALYTNQLDNTLLAWQRYTDPFRALHAGDLAFQEHFEQFGGTAYTLASILTLRQGIWKTRPWASFSANAMNGHPWVCFVDYQLGDRLAFEHEGIIYVDNLYGVKWEWSWEKPIGVTLKIGEDKMKGDPFGAAFRTIGNVYKFASQVAGEGTLFG